MDNFKPENEVKSESEKKKYEYLKCDICDEKLSRTRIKEHIAMSHGDGKYFQCEFCNKTFKTMQCLMRHQTEAHSQSKFQTL